MLSLPVARRRLTQSLTASQMLSTHDLEDAEAQGDDAASDAEPEPESKVLLQPHSALHAVSMRMCAAAFRMLGTRLCL